VTYWSQATTAGHQDASGRSGYFFQICFS